MVMLHGSLCRKLPNFTPSVILTPKSSPKLSMVILHGCEILFDLITVSSWHFGAGNVGTELLNRSVSDVPWSPLCFQSRQGL